MKNFKQMPLEQFKSEAWLSITVKTQLDRPDTKDLYRKPLEWRVYKTLEFLFSNSVKKVRMRKISNKCKVYTPYMSGSVLQIPFYTDEYGINQYHPIVDKFVMANLTE